MWKVFDCTIVNVIGYKCLLQFEGILGTVCLISGVCILPITHRVKIILNSLISMELVKGSEYKVHIFMIRINRRVDLALSVRMNVKVAVTSN